jgi:hypothetical protein
LNIGLFSWNIALIPEAPKFGLLAIYLEYTWSICHLVNMLPLRPLSFFCGEWHEYRNTNVICEYRNTNVICGACSLYDYNFSSNHVAMRLNF